MLLSFIIGLYIFLVLNCARQFMLNSEGNQNDEIQTLDKQLQMLEEKKDQIHKEKMDLETEAVKIFTLYEITKDITKSLSEKEAFKTFKQKLAEHVDFEECLFLDPQSEKVKTLKEKDDYFVFPLRGKRRKIGFLVIKGANEDDKEKIMILGTQFALALRRVKLYQEIEQTAITDSLTEVHTRRYTLERFQEEIVRSKAQKLNLSILMVDVDHFKKFNDNYGHLTGDQILREIGSIIKENLREIDIAGRYGGEEFCIVLPDTGLEGAQFAAGRIRRATEETTIKAYDTSIRTTVSIGISQYPQDGQKVSELVDKADWALYRAKKQGRNRVCAFGVYDD